MTETVLKQMMAYFAKRRVAVFGAQVLVSGIALGRLVWILVTVAKLQVITPADVGFYRWTRLFFHPADSGLINYFVLCLLVGIAALGGYLLCNRRTAAALERRLKDRHPLLLIAYLAVSTVATFSLPKAAEGYAPVLLLAVCVPALLLLTDLVNPKAWTIRTRVGIDFLLVGCLILLFVVVIKEPLRLATGPVYLMNEYPDLFGQTLVRGRFVTNDHFLSYLTKSDVADVKELLSQESSRIPSPQTLNGLQYLNLGDPERFYISNVLEYAHQNMGRGQINHIGHIYNPINEYRLGKPLREIYFQYGLGNTMLMKWVMDLFGGLSIQAYHKCYLFYPLYAILFLAMLLVLFRDPLYMLGAFAGYGAAYFFAGHIGLTLGAGIIPSIHLLDTVAIILMTLYLRRRQSIFLILLGLTCMGSLFINSRFGLMLGLSVFAGLLLYAIESDVQGRMRRLVGLSAALSLVILIPFIATPKTSAIYIGQFFAGYFSWQPDPIIVLLTTIYLVGSYAFLILLKNETLDLKYLYLTIALYAQGLFVYYYWSGLANHLPMVAPFLALQFFLMLHIIASRLPHYVRLSKLAQLLVPISVGGMLLFCIWTWGPFRIQEADFAANFRQHRTYRWEFDRALVISTLDPQVLQGAVALIQKYAGSEKGIYIVSKYDGIIPFLANRYSAMPHFELGYSLLSRKQVGEAIDRIRTGKPRHIFVDTNLIPFVVDPSSDLWSKLFTTQFDKTERASRFGRYAALQEVFSGVSDEYEKIDESEVITVFRRK